MFLYSHLSSVKSFPQVLDFSSSRYDPPLGFLSVADYANIATVVTCSPLDSVKKGHDSDSVEEFLLDAKRPAIRRAEDGRSSTVKTPTFADRRPLSSRVNCNYKQKSNLDFSPKDLIDANGNLNCISYSNTLFRHTLYSNKIFS